MISLGARGGGGGFVCADEATAAVNIKLAAISAEMEF